MRRSFGCFDMIRIMTRFPLHHFFSSLIMLFRCASFVLAVPAVFAFLPILFGKRFLFFLVGAGFLSIALVACEGSSSSVGGTPSSPRAFKMELTFAPISGGFRIGNRSDFGDLVSLDIRATSESEYVGKNINTTEFVDSSYEFTGLNDEFDWTFTIVGTLSNGEKREVEIVFIWDENRLDHDNGGMRSGLDTDEDRRADSVDEDDDNDDVHDNSDQCRAGETGWTSNSSSDYDGDGCRDASSEDEDDDNDRVNDNLDQCLAGEIDWESNGSSDNDGDGCRDMSEDEDDDNDGLDDTDEREQQISLDGVSCSLLADCDNDRVGDRDEAAGCILASDCDEDGVMDGEDIDDDGDGLIELARAAELDGVRYALRGNGSRLSEAEELDTNGCGGANGITSCAGYELVADISLVGYANWQPLGHDTDSSRQACQGDAFEGTFEGNGWTISNLTIDRSNQDCVGLFGRIAANSEIRNLRLRAERVVGRLRVGGLVGSGQSARIISSSVEVAEVSGDGSIGGLVGSGFDAAIISSSGVVGEVSGFAFVGGLVGNGQESRINSSSVEAAEVSGGDQIGGLVGNGEDARIVSSSVVANEVSGTGNTVGGLMGNGPSARIHYSAVVVGNLSGVDNLGGLVGYGEGARIHSSAVVAAEVRGNGNNVGGLVGNGNAARIHSSSVVAAEVSGTDDVGGLVGLGQEARIVSSSVVAAEVGRSGDLGGLVGFFQSGKLAYSYVVSGSNVDMLTGGGIGEGVASYWDSGTSGINSGRHGEAKTGDQLRMPTGYEGIYESWDNDMNIFSDGDEPLAVWCDEDNSGNITAGEGIDDNLIWDFGGSDEYPAIRCTPTAPAKWRSWWSLNEVTGEPQLNQTRLDNLLPSLD